MNNRNQHVGPAVQNEDMSPAEQENETIESKKRVFRRRLKNSENMTEAEIEALHQEHNSLFAQTKDLFKKIKARISEPDEVFERYTEHTFYFAHLRARTPALQDLNLLSTEAIDNWSNILEHDRKAREAKWELYRMCKENAEFETSCKKISAFIRKNEAYNEDDPTTWHNHLNRLVAVRKAHLDVIPTFQDEWRAYLDATAEYKFHRDAAKVENHTINIDTISDAAMAHVKQMSGAQTKALKAYHKILGLARADLARMKEVETLARKILDLHGRRKVFRVEELQRAEAVILWVQKTRTSIFNVLGEIKKNSV
ncbi:unnamed protein product [Aureobasidium pullulans]|nr:unnamed protein product [Aureobasidium pullulans]